MKTKILFFFAIFFATLTATNGQVCQIGTTNYTTLDAALTAVQNGQTIKLLTDINYTQGISISGKSITFDLNGKKLDVTNASGAGLSVTNGEVKPADPANGEFNVTGTSYGVNVQTGGKASVTSATASGNLSFGVYAGNGTVTVSGNVSAVSVSGCGAKADGGGTITIGGTVTAGSQYPFYAGNTPKAQGDVATPTTKPGYFTYTDNGTNNIWVRDQSYIFNCEIGDTQYELGDALAAVQDGQTIKLLDNITYNDGITIDGISVTFDLNGYTLNVVNTAGDGLDVDYNSITGKIGEVKLLDPTNGALNVTGSPYGVLVQGRIYHISNATVTSVTSTNDINDGRSGHGVYAGYGNIIVTGDITTNGYASEGAYAVYSQITIKGNIIVNGDNSYAVYAGSPSTITVNGNIAASGSGSTGVYASGAANVMAGGNVSGELYGVNTNGGTIVVNGNVTATASGVGSIGAWANSGKITIDGFITAPDYYIEVGTTPKFASQYTTPTTQTGYLTYTDGTNTVWVNANPFQVSATSMNFTAAGGHQTFDIQSVTTWMVGSSDAWLTISPSSGGNNGAITVTAAANTTSAARTATVTIMGNGVTARTITVTQDASTTAIEAVEAPDVNVYVQAGNVIVDSKTVAIKSVSVYGISGLLLKTVESGSNHVSIPQSFSPSILIVKVIAIDGTIVTRKIVN